MPSPPRPGANLVIAPSQPRAGLLRIRVLGDIDHRGAQRCARVVRGAVDAAAAERDGRGAAARVVCDLTEIGAFGAHGQRVLADAERYARRRDVAFEVVGAPDGSQQAMPTTVHAAG